MLTCTNTVRQWLPSVKRSAVCVASTTGRQAVVTVNAFVQGAQRHTVGVVLTPVGAERMERRSNRVVTTHGLVVVGHWETLSLQAADHLVTIQLLHQWCRCNGGVTHTPGT
jgi:hypothetical protein